MLFVVMGPPGAGKTTYVAEHARPGDIRIDLDHIANLLAGVDVGNHSHEGHVLGVARAARLAAVDASLKHVVDHDVWVIDSWPGVKARAKYQAVGAEFVLVDPGKDVVLGRCSRERSGSTVKAAALWYSKRASEPALKSSSLKVFSFAWGKIKPNGLVLDARGLSNPHVVPSLRILDGRSSCVREWLESQPDVQAFVDQAVAKVRNLDPIEVWVGCSAGQHRSVYVAEEIAATFGVEAEHLSMKSRKRESTTDRGYGWHDHQKPRELLLRKHRDGTSCWWCGLPMYKDKAKNWDGRALARDHIEANGAKNRSKEDRLMHFTCNSQRRDGSNDAIRPAVTGKDPWEPLSAVQDDKPALNLNGFDMT
ncbi:putative ATPase [Corynebacterium phage phi16]|uniref:RapZ C-terminal domain-containing protein n=1 Tax=Corynebacterium glutamicum TaxID=1718 RepID=UPI00097E3B81|nr:RNase adapter RapZ [Corynebacterium glutamicum]APQ42604.1 putative ATPase [Corynebacterium phage phi16]